MADNRNVLLIRTSTADLYNVFVQHVPFNVYNDSLR